MEFWFSAEVEKSVYEKLLETEKAITIQIRDAFVQGSLSRINLELCYIPIIMGPDFAEFYPARTKFDSGERKLYHSPVLDFSVFQGGSLISRRNEYLLGLLKAHRWFEKMSLMTVEEIAHFVGAVESLQEIAPES